MTIKPVTHIITARDYSDDGTPQGYLRTMAARIANGRGIRLDIDYDESHAAGKPLLARVERGQWIADCECNTAMFVDPMWPFTFCFGCRQNGSALRPVVFPKDWREVELLLLQRPVNESRGLDHREQAGLSFGLIEVEGKGRLDRTWWPSETVKDLHDQQDDPVKQHMMMKLRGR